MAETWCRKPFAIVHRFSNGHNFFITHRIDAYQSFNLICNSSKKFQKSTTDTTEQKTSTKRSINCEQGENDECLYADTKKICRTARMPASDRLGADHSRENDLP